MASVSPVRKRVRLDPSASPSPPPSNELKLQRRETAHSVFDDRVGMPQHDELLEVDIAEEDDEDYCVICLHHIRDRTVLPCAHDRLCFECIYVWCQQSRKCPLCNASIGPFLIHNFRSKYDYSKYYLSPLELSTPNAGPLARSEFIPRTRGRTRGPQPHWGTRRRNASGSPERRDREDELELAIARRRWVYRHGLYAKHVASNPYTRYHPAPTPAQISSSPDLISRTTIFVRRELRVWVNLDVEFLTTFILSLMKTLDLRSEPAVKLLAEFLDMDTPYYVGEPEADSTGRFKNAEHFSHELYSYLRSPFRELAAYDSAVQYDTPAHVPPPPPQRLDERHGPRWDLRTSSRAEPSGPHRRRHSSPSPLSRSPRDAYSPSSSPAPSQFRNDFEHHDSPQPEPVNRPQRAYRINNSSSTAAKTRTDTKGKGRTESLPSKADTWRLHYEDRFHHLPEERRVQSSSRSLVQPDVNSPSREPHRHSSFAVSSMVKGIRQERSDSGLHSGSPLTSLPLYESTGDSNRREDIPRDLPTREQSCLRERDHSVKAVDHQPETQDTPWGISIKGQAKLLDLPREAVLMISDSHRETRSTDAHTTSLPKKRSRVLDVVHAHLRPSYTLPAKRSATIGNSAKHPPAEERAPSRDSDVLEGSSNSPLSTTLQPAASTSRVSAREIMARTRAKLAKLRTESPQTPVIHGVIDTPSTGEITETSPSCPDFRSRLVKRLEEEKRQAVGELPSTQCSSDHPNSDELGLSEARDENSRENASAESQKAEIKLRAQALLRVRLAAEKRKASINVDPDQETTSREGALRARLLSRRT